jgi:glutathione synthase
VRIAFLMDKLESINPVNETTSHLMYECNERGHTVYFLEPHDVYIRNTEVVARMRNITVLPGLSMKLIDPMPKARRAHIRNRHRT